LIKHQGHLYIGTVDNNEENHFLLKINTDNNETEKVAFVDDIINQLTLAGEAIAVGTENGLYQYENNSLSLLVENVRIFDMAYEIETEKIWFGRIDVEWYENHLYTYHPNEGMKSTEVELNGTGPMTFDNDGKLWIGKFGLITYNGLGPFSTLNGLPNDRIEDLIVDQNNNVWITTANGIAIYNQNSNINLSSNTVCIDESVNFSYNSTNDTELNWSIVKGNDTILKSNQNQFDYLFTDSGNYQIILETKENNGCNKTEIQSIVVHSKVKQVFLLDSYPLCNNTDTAFISIRSNMLSYEWIYDGNVISTDNEIFTQQAGLYTVNISDYCGGSTTLTTIVSNELNAVISTSYNADQTVATLSTNYYFDNSTTFLWSTGSTNPIIEVADSGKYSVTVYLNGCESTDEIEVSFQNIDTGLETVSVDDINIYPNPTSDFIFIQTQKAEVLNVQLYDIKGTLINETRIEGEYPQKINLQDLNSGIYILKTQTSKSQNKMGKIIKN